VFASPQINVYVEDVPRSAAFYERLGFVETFRTPVEGVPIHVELVLDGFTIGIASVASARADHGLAVSSAGNAVEICLWCDDADAAYDALLAAGATSMSAPHDWLDGRLRVAWVADPEGNPVELVQRSDRQVTGE
jgi:catechol 2,3-dioxygenase-like lactoylglutathione lyase family enzyme